MLLRRISGLGRRGFRRRGAGEPGDSGTRVRGSVVKGLGVRGPGDGKMKTSAEFQGIIFDKV
jgi:hypothetical protein